MPEPRQKPGRSKQDYSTPWEFIDAVRARFGSLAWDLAADVDNTKASRYFTVADNSLLQDWTKLRGNLWLNPPFGDIEPWACKCRKDAPNRRLNDMILMLTPASVGSNWFLRHVHGQALVLALNPRMSFDGKEVYPKDLMLTVWSKLFEPSFDVWRWKGPAV